MNLMLPRLRRHSFISICLNTALTCLRLLSVVAAAMSARCLSRSRFSMVSLPSVATFLMCSTWHMRA